MMYYVIFWCTYTFYTVVAKRIPKSSFLSKYSPPLACSATTWGTDCANTCTCDTANTDDCDDVTGVCSCNTGITGANCDTGQYLFIICFHNELFVI